MTCATSSSPSKPLPVDPADRVGKRSARAPFRIAADLLAAGYIDMDEALARVDGGQLQSLLHPKFAAGGATGVVATGLAASPGAAVGELVFSAGAAVLAAAQGRQVVLARPETSPDDLAGMLVAEAVMTSRGGLTSHAAVVARGLGRVCVTGLGDLNIDVRERRIAGPGGLVRAEGDVVSVDGTTGEVCRGRREVRPSAVAAALSAMTDVGVPGAEDAAGGGCPHAGACRPAPAPEGAGQR